MGVVGYRFLVTPPKPGTQTAAKATLVQEASEMAPGCEGRISVLKHRHGLKRCRYKGPNGMKRYVGLGVIADNIIHIGDHLAGHANV